MRAAHRTHPLNRHNRITALPSLGAALLGLLLLLPTACSSGSESVTEPVPTGAPSTSAALATAAATATPSQTPFATSVVASPSPGVTVSPSPSPMQLFDPEVGIPEGEIQIYTPGPLSRLASPFRLIGNLEPGPGYRVYIELLGEDGRTLTSMIIRALPPGGMVRTDFVASIEFEIDALAEAARLVVSVHDEANRVSALASVDVILLAEGVTLNNPYQDAYESIIIQKPDAKASIEGGSLIVTGLARPRENDILRVELIDARGAVVASRLALVVVPDGEQYGLFAVEVPYEVQESTPVLLVVREEGTEYPGPVHLSSTEITLNP
jgi:hypothetical protein